MKSSDWLKTSTKLLLETFMTKGMFRSTSVDVMTECGVQLGFYPILAIFHNEIR
jgi:hypothetical protein